VLPFKPLVSGSGDVYLELGMADTLITELSNIRDIEVRPTSAVIAYTAPSDPVAIGRKLGVEAVLDGRIQRAGDRVRVTAQLVRVDDGSSLWAGKFDEDLKNILAVQDAISARIVSALTLDLSGDEKQSLEKHATESSEAYQLYLRGRYHWYRWTPEGWQRARDYFEQAVAKDPKFALAWSGLADAISLQQWIRPRNELAPQAKAAASRALELDPRLPEANLSLGGITLFFDWDHKAAERVIKHAIELNPNFAQGHDLYALLLVSEARFDEAIAQSRRARELDPTSPYMNTDLGQIYYYKRDYDKAAEQIRVALAIDPNYADVFRYGTSIAEQQKDEAGAIDASVKFLVANGDPEIAAAVRAAYASSGYASAQQVWLAELTKKSATTYVSPLDVAEIHARLGHREEAIAALRKAIDDRAPGATWLGGDPRWDAYRDDPRFRAMLKELGVVPPS